MNNREASDRIAEYTNELLERLFGCRIENCTVYADGAYVCIYIHGFLTSMEEVLLKDGHLDVVRAARRQIISALMPELRGVIQMVMDSPVDRWFDDWSYTNNTGMLLLELQNKRPDRGEGEVTHPFYAAELKSEVSRLSALVEKVPDRIETRELHADVVLVVRRGLLVPIEKALHRKGFDHELLMTKEELEKSSFHHNGTFSDIFRRPVNDIFFDWRLAEDIGVIVFMLNRQNM
ncbi:Na-translocating system protein MpsC family protein [Paenibacillus chartarius]|uniref:Na-translocating system protein MpsC family protein n=1 Tax=Paenibacillus chartarius TaxID=747481 RepID=A0ABV6DUC2_9BACL